MKSTKACERCGQFLIDDVTPHETLKDCFEELTRRVGSLEHKEQSRQYEEGHRTGGRVL